MDGKLISGPKIGYDLARVGASETRGANRKKQLNAAAWSGTWPAPGSSLDLDFVNNRGWVRGSGQGGVMDAITFTRASNGTYVGEDGLLKSYSNQGALGKNLLTFPQDFDNAAWTKVGITQDTRAAIAPDETTTAIKITENSNNSQHYLFNATGTSVPAGTYTGSFYAKAAERFRATAGIWNGSNNEYVQFDLINGTIVQEAVSGIATITDVGDGWYRCTVKRTIGAALTYLSIGLHPDQNITNLTNNTLVYQGDGTSGIFIWGAQLEEGDQATEYFPTNIGVPRFDWGSTESLSIPNHIENSDIDKIVNTFDNFTTTKDVWMASPTFVESYSTDGTMSPDGLIETIKLVMVTSTNLNEVADAGIATNSHNKLLPVFTPCLFSVYAKAAGYSAIRIRIGNYQTGRSSAFFDLTGQGQSKILGGLFNLDNLNITSLDDGWYRCSFTLNTNAVITITPCSDYDSSTCAGNSVDGVYLYGAQLETGDVTTPSVYIKTGVGIPSRTPLAANPTMNGILVEEARTNRVLWCRDATQTIPYTPPDNFFAQSETFTNASWNFDGNQAQLVRTENQSDPFDGTSATKIVPNAGRTAANAYIGQRSGASYPSTHSIYAKAAEYDYIVLSLFTYAAGNFAVFNLSDGTITTSPTVAGLTAAIESVGDGWYRCSLTTSNETLNRGFLVSVSPNGTTTATAAGGSGIFIYGAHSNNGDTPTTYVQTTVLDSPLWVLTDITAAKDQTGIDGVANAASSLTATANNGTCFQYITLLSGARTCSAYLKRITGTGIIQITLDGVTWSTVELSDTEWRRVSVSGTVTNPTLGIRMTTSGDSVAMDFAQVEDKGFVTSPILTTISSATRIGDFPTTLANRITGLQFNTGLSFYTEFVPFSINPGTQSHVFNYSATTDNGFMLTFYGGSALFWGRQTGFQTISLQIPFLVRNTISGSFRESGSNMSNGNLAIETGRDISFPGITRRLNLYIGCIANGSGQINGTINRIIIWPTPSNPTQSLELSRVTI
jgi:hypothetical protein